MNNYEKHLLKCKRRYWSKKSDKNWLEEERLRKRLLARKLFESNPEKLREYWRKKSRKRYAELKKLRRFDTKEVMARAKLGQAVFYGKILKPVFCVDCKKKFPKSKINGHHNDYSKPLEVEWLCTRCHGLRHRLALQKISEVG